MSNHPHAYIYKSTIYNSYFVRLQITQNMLQFFALRESHCGNAVQLGLQGIEKVLAISMLHLQQYLSLATGKVTVVLCSYILCMSWKRLGGGHFFCFASCLASSSCSLYHCMRKQYKDRIYFLCGILLTLYY